MIQYAIYMLWNYEFICRYNSAAVHLLTWAHRKQANKATLSKTKCDYHVYFFNVYVKVDSATL